MAITIKRLVLALLLGGILIACGQEQNYETSRAVNLDADEGIAKLIFATPHSDGQLCFYESVLESSEAKLEDNCELLTPESIDKNDFASAAVGNSRWANIRANFYMTPLVSTAACLASALLLVRWQVTHRVLLCTGYIVAGFGMYVATRALKAESKRKTRKILSSGNYKFDKEDYQYLRNTFSVLQSSNSTPCPRKPDLRSKTKANQSDGGV